MAETLRRAHRTAAPAPQRRVPTATMAVAYTPVPLTVRALLEAGAHFGHQTRRWNPR